MKNYKLKNCKYAICYLLNSKNIQQIQLSLLIALSQKRKFYLDNVHNKIILESRLCVGRNRVVFKARYVVAMNT